MPVSQHVVECDIEAVYLNKCCRQVLHVPEDVHEKDVVRGDGRDAPSLDLNIVAVVQAMDLLVEQVHLDEVRKKRSSNLPNSFTVIFLESSVQNWSTNLMPVWAALAILVPAMMGNLGLDPEVVLCQIGSEFLANHGHLSIAVTLNRVHPRGIQNLGCSKALQVTSSISL